MSKKDNLTTELSRELSLFQITAMGLGMMIGAGVFPGMGNTIYDFYRYCRNYSSN